MTTTRLRTQAASAAPALDETIHQRVRLGIVSALAAGGPLSFNDLKAVLNLTDGNLSVHARKLEEAGYVACHKRSDERPARTEYELTTDGRRALEAYLHQMEAVLQAARPS